MATRITTATRQTAIEIDGKTAAFLASASLPRIDWPRAAAMPPPHRGAAVVGPIAASLGPFAASAAITGAGGLLDWLLTLPRGSLAATTGALIETDLSFDAKRRIDWSGGLLTEVQWPTLDAREGKLPVRVAFKWQPASIEFSKGSGKLPAALSSRAKAWLASNFRVSLGGGKIDGKLVNRVEMPLLRAQAARATIGREQRPKLAGGVEIGPLRVSFSGAGRDAALDFAQAAMKSGVEPAADSIDIVIEMLDAALKKILGTFRLGDCLLLAYEEPASDSQAERVAETVLTFSVGSFDLQA